MSFTFCSLESEHREVEKVAHEDMNFGGGQSGSESKDINFGGGQSGSESMLIVMNL